MQELEKQLNRPRFEVLKTKEFNLKKLEQAGSLSNRVQKGALSKQSGRCSPALSDITAAFAFQ